MRELDQSGIDKLLQEPIFKLISPEDQARLLTHVRVREFAPGEPVFDPSTSLGQVFLIHTGCLEVKGTRATSQRDRGFIGEELVLGANAYTGTATATQPTVVYAFPVRYLSDLVSAYTSVKSLFFASYAKQDNVPANQGRLVTSTENASRAAPERFGAQLFGWVAAVAAPLLLWHFCIGLGLNKDAAYFVAIVSCAVVMWLFNLVPAFIPPLFSILAIILFDIAPAHVAVAGFSSNGFFMLLSIFSIGALMVISGLTYRISLHILKVVPATPFWYNISLFLYGLILTPVIPSQLGRTTIVGPFLSTLIETAGAKKNDPAVANMVVSAMAGVGLAASIFLTGKPANLIIFGLFDTQTQFTFAWLQWFFAAAFTGLLMVALYLAIAFAFFRKTVQVGIPKHVIKSQIRTLGRMTPIEWAAVLAITMIVTGILTASLHMVEIPWMAMTIFVTLLLFGTIQKDDISRRVDWSVLIFIASIVGWVPVMKLTGIDAQIASSFSWVGGYMKTQLPVFILVLCVVIILIRFALPEIVTEILLVTLLLPLASRSGVSPWLIGFIILTMCEAYIFPYQAPYHLQLKNQLAAAGQENSCDESKVVRLNILMTLIRVAAIYMSLPYWKYLDIV